MIPLNKIHSVEVERVAVLIPYLGDNLPLWFNTFALSASSTAAQFEWFIFITEAPLRPVPVNVHLVRMSRQEVYQRFAMLDHSEHDSNISTSGADRAFLQYSFQRLIEEHPYVLVEFKSTLGYVFSDLIPSSVYSHWAYADMDVLAGRVDMHVSQEHLKKFDVLSFSFGDNYRLYLRGQLTVLRNTHSINNMWRQCPHLQDVGKRLIRAYGDRVDETHDRKDKVLPFNWHFQSAEGCFSRVVMDASNVSVLFLSSQLSDAFRGSTREKESLLVGRAVMRCYDSGLDLSEETEVMRDYLGGHLQIGHRPSSQELKMLQKGCGQYNANILYRVNGSCSYWIEPQYDVCVSDVPAIANVLKDSSNVISHHTVYSYQIPDSSCREAVIVHFQGWKKQYTAFTTRPPSADTHVLLVTDSGFIPLRLTGAASSQLQTFGEQYKLSDLHAGRLTINTLQAADGDESESEKFPHDLMSSYCAAYSDSLKACLCFVPLSSIRVTQRASRPLVDSDVTLVAAAWTRDFNEGHLDAMLNSWDGPKLLVLASMSSDGGSISSHVEKDVSLSIIIVNLGTCARYLKSSTNIYLLPDNMLLNIGLDAVRSDLVCVVPYDAVMRGVFRGGTLSGDERTMSVTHSLRQQLMEADRYMHKLSTSQITHYPATAALVVPVFTLSTDAEKTSTPVPSTHLCGQNQQPESLTPRHDPNLTPEKARIAFNAQSLLQEHTSMLPMVFNVSAGPHGRDFVRFPEEMNGQGCFDGVIMRVLAGAGYTLHWVTKGIYVNMEKTAGDSVTGKDERQCGCISRLTAKEKDTQALQIMTGRINSYFLRAVELRNKGVSSVYTGKRFGESFERNVK